MLQSSLFSSSQDLAAVAAGERRILAPEASDSVSLIQEALVFAGFDLPDAGVDGIFSEETGLAVSAFKVDRGLTTIDSVVDDETITRLDREEAYSEAIPVEVAMVDTSIVVRDPWVGAILDTVSRSYAEPTGPHRQRRRDRGTSPSARRLR